MNSRCVHGVIVRGSSNLFGDGVSDGGVERSSCASRVAWAPANSDGQTAYMDLLLKLWDEYMRGKVERYSPETSAAKAGTCPGCGSCPG